MAASRSMQNCPLWYTNPYFVMTSLTGIYVHSKLMASLSFPTTVLTGQTASNESLMKVYFLFLFTISKSCLQNHVQWQSVGIMEYAVRECHQPAIAHRQGLHTLVNTARQVSKNSFTKEIFGNNQVLQEKCNQVCLTCRLHKMQQFRFQSNWLKLVKDLNSSLWSK